MPAPAPPTSLPFGSQSAYTDSLLGPVGGSVEVTPETCWNLSVFKDVMKRYRKLDDTIIIRLNRANAQLRDNNRSHALPSSAGGEDESCLALWREMTAGWDHRQSLLTYCLNTVDGSLAAARRKLEGQERGLDKRREEDGLFGQEVLRNQIANEESVERIVRKRSMDAFRSRCQFFRPPSTDERASEWWSAAEVAR